MKSVNGVANDLTSEKTAQYGQEVTEMVKIDVGNYKIH